MTFNLARRRVLTAATLCFTVSTSIWPGTATAQESDGWKFRITPYLWALGMDGTTAALGNDVPVEADFGDILDLVNLALSANMEWNNGDWFVVLDPMWADLEAPIEPGGPIGGKIEIELIIVDAVVGYNVAEHIGIYAGARYYDQDIAIVPNMLPSQDLGDDWTDFILGVRFLGDINDRWGFAAKLDVAAGGDSDSAGYAQIMFRRHIGDNKEFDIGYRYYTVDYESGSGLTRFKWDVDHFGPVFGFSWVF